MEASKTMAERTGIYARRKQVPGRVPVKTAPELATPLGQAMQTLCSVASLMGNASPQGGTSANPKLILTSTGLELRFANTESPAAAEPSDRLAEMQRDLKLLATRIGKIEEQLGSQSAVVDSLRAAVQQNEEILETLVDSVHLMDELSVAQPELAIGTKTLPS